MTVPLSTLQAELLERWEAEDTQHNAEVAKIRAEFQQKVRALQDESRAVAPAA